MDSSERKQVSILTNLPILPVRPSISDNQLEKPSNKYFYFFNFCYHIVLGQQISLYRNYRKSIDNFLSSRSRVPDCTDCNKYCNLSQYSNSLSSCIFFYSFKLALSFQFARALAIISLLNSLTNTFTNLLNSLKILLQFFVTISFLDSQYHGHGMNSHGYVLKFNKPICSFPVSILLIYLSNSSFF